MSAPRTKLINEPADGKWRPVNWRDEPATEKQVNYLADFGFVSSGPLSKGEASDLITQFSDDPERCLIRDRNDSKRMQAEWDRAFEEDQKHRAYLLHQQIDQARSELANAKRGEIGDWKFELRQLTQARIRFWKDTFTEIGKVEDFCEQAADLHSEFGYRFKMPKSEQIQSIIDALDGAWPVWDRDKPQIFFETLEMNFPALLR